MWTKPLRRLTTSTSLGYQVIHFAETILEMELLPWQKWLLIHALELLPDGSLRFRNIVVLVARQNGKSTLSQVLALWWLYVCGCHTVLGTAQDLDTAEEVWEGAWDIIEGLPQLRERADTPVRVNGKKAIRLLTGERYRVKAANRRAGRGFSGDRIMLDELREHQSWDAWGAITKTTMARPDAQIWCYSNAGDVTSIVLRYLRKMAHLPLGDPDGINAADEEKASKLLPDSATLNDMVDRGLVDDDIDHLDFAVDEDDLAIFEWSAPPGCDIRDRDAWAQANPSMGYTISERTIASAARTDPEWVFRTEVLCQWSEGGLEGPFETGKWEKCAAKVDKRGQLLIKERVAADSRVESGLAVSHDRRTAYVGVAGKRPDGRVQVEIAARRPGTDWVADWYSDPQHPDRARWPIVVKVGSPAWTLAADLREAGLDVVEWSGREVGVGCGNLYDEVSREELRHTSQPLLNVPAATAVTQPLQGGLWTWDLRKSPTDAAPLEAITGAYWGLAQPKKDAPPPPPPPQVVTAERGDVARSGDIAHVGF